MLSRRATPLPNPRDSTPAPQTAPQPLPPHHANNILRYDIRSALLGAQARLTAQAEARLQALGIALQQGVDAAVTLALAEYPPLLSEPGLSTLILGWDEAMFDTAYDEVMKELNE